MARIAVLCEVLHPPLDEGVRIVAAEIAAALSRRHEVTLFGAADAEVKGLQVRGVLTDRWFLGAALGREIRRARPEWMLYVPWTSLTPRTFVRILALRRRAPGVPIGVVALQPRPVGLLGRLASIAGTPDRLFISGPEAARQAEALRIPFRRIEGGIDLGRFLPRADQPVEDLRRRLGLPLSSHLVLHVGHLKASRGVLVLKSLQALEGVQALLIASSSTDAEGDTLHDLQRAGVRVIDHPVEEIEAYYRAADCYVFPVISSLDAIEVPLSVLEAMACNLPIVTTRFGGLASLLAGPPPGVTFVEALEEIPEAVTAFRSTRPRPDLRDRLGDLTWDAVSERIAAALGGSDSSRGAGRRVEDRA